MPPNYELWNFLVVFPLRDAPSLYLWNGKSSRLHSLKLDQPARQPLYWSAMKLRNESVFVAELTTIGRRTGLPRTVELRLVYLDGRFYASSTSIQKKHWCRNLVKNPAVEIKTGGERFACQARQLTDENHRVRVLTLRDSPALMDRVVFEMTPKNPPQPRTINPG